MSTQLWLFTEDEYKGWFRWLRVRFVVERLVGFLLVVSVGGLFVICVIVEAVDVCTDCEETWQTEEDQDFL